MSEQDILRDVQGGLAFLVPITIAEFRPLTVEARMVRAGEDSSNIAHNADQLIRGQADRRSRKNSVLASVARAMAIGAFNPGGITFLGVHACDEPHEDCPGGNLKPGDAHPVLGKAHILGE